MESRWLETRDDLHIHDVSMMLYCFTFITTEPRSMRRTPARMSRSRSQPTLIPRLVLALVLVLAQSLVLAHQQDHDWTPDATVCDQCLSSQNLDSGISGNTGASPVEQISNTCFNARGHELTPRPTATSRLTRAPPSFSH